ncbi:MAG: ATP-binding protein [Chloroflexota bacterium]
MSDFAAMSDSSKHPGSLPPNELETVYAISRAVAGSQDTEAVLDEIVRLVRTVLIFDNMVLYTCCSENGALEPAYARAIGRGRAREADLAWGEKTAQRVYQEKQPVMRVDEPEDDTQDRINLRHSLGLPLKIAGQAHGALVFIRFGGPQFLPAQVHLAEFIALHVAQLLEHRQLVEKIADLEARRRLDSLQEDFISTISHELLTPLGFVKGYATTLLREDIHWDDPTRREFLTIIDEEADRLHELIDNMLDSSRLQAGTLRINFQPIRLDTMLRDISLRARSRNEQLQLELAIDYPPVQIQADPSRLAQVFDNIINNAMKYAPGSPIHIQLTHEDDRAHITIQDFGPGIPADHLENLFKRFFRVPGQDTTVRGTGLGLYISRKLIQSHGGEIRAESQPGHGTTFHIYLPDHWQGNDEA